MSYFLIGIDFIFECNSRLFHALTTSKKGPLAQRIRHLTTNLEIPESNPGGVAVILSKQTLYPMDFFYFFKSPFTKL